MRASGAQRSLLPMLLLMLVETGFCAQGDRLRSQISGRKPYVQKKLHPCEQSSCYPATGNLLIGRESKLSATSTCGLRGPETYCIVSHLDHEGKKCFRCDTSRRTENDPVLNHQPSNIIYRFHPGTLQRSWWQSQNGIENVTLQLDLEAEFHFTHLIILFKTFRPAAMLVERSFDFGKTWRVYRYFAHDCRKSFPGVDTRPPRLLTDVVCESRYSLVAPSTDGEVIFRVLPPNIVVDNPYSIEVQNLLKMTNLRINFTGLHTLGDDLLDDRAEIKEKYYYAITEMTVRGSCSCYGHASRCLPLRGVESKMDMVHGRCECTHNTKGLNCEKCEDFFNDLPWKPAIGKTTNACKRCTCNNHATTCHFDAAVYNLTAKVSGGVCDDCQHNTEGRNCELCKPFFYRDPQLHIQDPQICKPCDCDPRGSLDAAICDSVYDGLDLQESGRCHCKINVEGRRCDMCKNGYWDFDEQNPDGCKECTCNGLGTVDKEGCDVYTGECTCKRNVIGRDCNQCQDEFFGLSQEEEGCQPCDCDVGGSLDNFCDVVDGQCRCRPNVQGRRCDQPGQHFFSGALDALIYEAETSTCDMENDPNSIGTGGNCQILVREPFGGGIEDTWTGTGFMKVYEDNRLEFTIDDIITSMDYDIVLRYESQGAGDWQEVTVHVERPGPVGMDSPCANLILAQDTMRVVLPDNARSATVQPSVCLEADKVYKIKIDISRQNPNAPNARATVLIDSIVLIPKMMSLPFLNDTGLAAEARREEFRRARCEDAYYYDIHKVDLPEICKKFHTSIAFYVFNGALSCQCDATGSISHKCEEHGGLCPCKTNVVGRRCNRCASGTFDFSPVGCKACDCSSIGALDNFCSPNGQCKCRQNTYGRQCDECQPGYWNFPDCRRCECNGHADVCDPKTGACTSCRDRAEGHRCDRCAEGHYGDPRLGVDIPCRACPCPGTQDSGHSFAARCLLDDITKDVVCECEDGYAGSRCDVCADNYFGHPETPGGSCRACDCNGNIDAIRPGNCDPHTGKCLQCLHETEGDRCEVCKSGFYGDALMKSCERCVCEILGTNGTVGPCNQSTGQCPCHPNVIGLGCDRCLENHWKIASGEGCEACDCDPDGSTSEQCNEYDGQCVCRTGLGGRRCDQCETNFWGDPNVDCHLCECDERGSESQQCRRDNGACVCVSGIGGYNCDECARGFLGVSPHCSACGECFDNWDRIVSGMLNQTNLAIADAAKIKTVGATGAYSRDFEGMENKLDTVQNLVSNTKVGMLEVNIFDEKVDTLKEKLLAADKNVTGYDSELADATSSINLAKAALEDLDRNVAKLKNNTQKLEVDATKLQEANLEGALNLTRDAKRRSIDAADDADSAQKIIGDCERQIKGTELLVERQYLSFNNTQKENDKVLAELQEKLNELVSQIPELNDNMCGHVGGSCDHLCGGAGCGKCGGISCERGAVTKADQALDFANKTEIRIRDHELAADDLLRGMSHAKQDTADARAAALKAHDAVFEEKTLTGNLVNESNTLTQDLKEFLKNTNATPEGVRTLASQVMGMKIDLEPERITQLAGEIEDTVSQLTDIESIIEETREDLQTAKELEESALAAKADALDTLATATNVVEALGEAAIAQKAAEEAIKKANEDIEAAKNDLSPIAKKTDEAQRKANDTAAEVEGLKTRLGIMQRNIYQIDNDAQHVKDEVGKVVNVAVEAQQIARGLRQGYQEAEKSLTERAHHSAGAREKARQLLARATQLAADTQSQLKQLQSMEDLYNSHASSLSTLEARIADLNKQVAYYLSEITRKSNGYRQCST